MNVNKRQIINGEKQITDIIIVKKKRLKLNKYSCLNKKKTIYINIQTENLNKITM